jgi:hypothetical protein
VTPDQLRSSRAWKTVRARVLRHATGCEICGRPFMAGVKPRTRWAPSVDHVRPLHEIDLSTAEGRRMALDPSLLRAVHLGCNSRRGVIRAAAVRRARDWGRPRIVAEGEIVERAENPGPQRADWNEWIDWSRSGTAAPQADAARSRELTGDIPARTARRPLFDQTVPAFSPPSFWGTL